VEVVLRQTAIRREQLKALFFEDDREVARLVIQRFNAKGQPLDKGSAVTLSGAEIAHLKEFLSLIDTVPLDDESRLRIDPELLQRLAQRPELPAEVYGANRDELLRLIRSDAKASDVIAVANRRKSVDEFDNLLHDRAYFDQMKQTWDKKRDEDVWQHFFDSNRWIFGFGLSGQLLLGWDEQKFETTIQGADAWTRGKRTDALMQTAGILRSLCFVEIKLPAHSLLDTKSKSKTKPYRSEAWAAGPEVVGGIAQSHTTIDKALAKGQILMRRDGNGYTVGEPAYVCRPRSFLLIGHHQQFLGDDGRVNEPMYRSFENYRRATTDPEIITYDELLVRARHLLYMAEENATRAAVPEQGLSSEDGDTPPWYDEEPPF
jgi:hypothetical protein